MALTVLGPPLAPGRARSVQARLCPPPHACLRELAFSTEYTSVPQLDTWQESLSVTLGAVCRGHRGGCGGGCGCGAGGRGGGHGVPAAAEDPERGPVCGQERGAHLMPCTPPLLPWLANDNTCAMQEVQVAGPTTGTQAFYTCIEASTKQGSSVAQEEGAAASADVPAPLATKSALTNDTSTAKTGTHPTSYEVERIRIRCTTYHTQML